MNVEIGDRFPFEELSSVARLPAVVYFYPKDSTEGCELESRGFNSLHGTFAASGVAIVGVSAGEAAGAAAFAAECALEFPLVPSRKLCEQLDLMLEVPGYGVFPRRVTFLLDRDGIVRETWDVEDVVGHARSVLDAAATLD